MFTYDDLNPFSLRFATALFTTYPEWRTLSDIPTGEEWDRGALRVTVPSPLGDRELSIDTDRGEVTVGFGSHGWHAHYWPWDDVPEATVFQRALTEIAALVSEECAILTRYVDGRVQSSETFYSDESIDWDTTERVEIVSWVGTRDVSLTRPVTS